MKITPVMPLGYGCCHNNLVYGMAIPEPQRPRIEKTHYPCHYFEVCGNYSNTEREIVEDNERINVYLCEECADNIDRGDMGDWRHEYV